MIDQEPITVEYAGTLKGKHNADIMDCVKKTSKTFSSYILAANFISECTYVYNLDQVLEAIPSDIIPGISSEVYELENFDISAIDQDETEKISLTNNINRENKN